MDPKWSQNGDLVDLPLSLISSWRPGASKAASRTDFALIFNEISLIFGWILAYIFEDLRAVSFSTEVTGIHGLGSAFHVAPTD